MIAALEEIRQLIDVLDQLERRVLPQDQEGRDAIELGREKVRQAMLALAAPELRDTWPMESALQWSDCGGGNWRAYFNNIEIGGYTDSLSEHWAGHYHWFGNTKFKGGEAASPTIARQRIEDMFQQWLGVAAAARKVTPNGDEGLRRAVETCTWCRGKEFTFDREGTRWPCPICRPYREALAASAAVSS